MPDKWAWISPKILIMIKLYLRFKVEWLTHGYHDKAKVERDRDSGILSKKVANALLGVHKRHDSLAKTPSDLDIQLLKEVYGGMYKRLCYHGT